MHVQAYKWVVGTDWEGERKGKGKGRGKKEESKFKMIGKMKTMNGINKNQATNLKNKEEDGVEISGLTTQLGHIMFFLEALLWENMHIVFCWKQTLQRVHDA